MAENSPIEWTDHTFNPWWGCAKVSPACDFCYAERDAHRFHPRENYWGVDAPRRTFGQLHWAEPLKWNRKAREAGIPARVFCASMADVFDKNAPQGERDLLWTMIASTPWLRWLLLTKRVGNVPSMLPADWDRGYSNVWLGISVCNQKEADRDVPKLLDIPATVRFLSCEPLLGAIDLERGGASFLPGRRLHGGVDWVIAGGESGPSARPMAIRWARQLRDQCAIADVPFLFKQWGEWVPHDHVTGVAPLRGTADRVEGEWMLRVGKKPAGRMLDGRTWNGVPNLAIDVAPLAPALTGNPF